MDVCKLECTFSAAVSFATGSEHCTVYGARRSRYEDYFEGYQFLAISLDGLTNWTITMVDVCCCVCNGLLRFGWNLFV
jgi:hypothetical protein